jgi:hypothetical protein
MGRRLQDAKAKRLDRKIKAFREDRISVVQEVVIGVVEPDDLA